MIIREIKDNPELIESFDWFNDYTDTRKWCRYNYPEILDRLDRGHEKYLQIVSAKFKEKNK